MLEAITRPVRRRRAVGNAESGLVRILVLPIWRLRPAPENEQLYRPVSPDDPDVRALAESIRRHGVKEPLVVSLDHYIISGHRRCVAARLAGLSGVPCRIEPIHHDVDHDQFLVLLREHNRQRVKSFDEVLREEIVSADPDEAYQELVEYRRGQARLGVAVMEIGERKERAKISQAKEPFLQAVIEIIDSLKDFWPISERRIHYALLNDPPLRHASKPGSTYANNKQSSKDLSDLITRARNQGRIAYESISDDTRPTETWHVYANPRQFLRQQFDDFLRFYFRNLMQSQPNHVELIGEKNTLKPIIGPVLADYTIPYYLGRGFSSHPPMKKLQERFFASGKERLTLLLLSDFDCDGVVIASSVARIIRDEYNIANIDAIRVALNPEHVKRYALPPGGRADDKESVNREKFVRQFGELTYELEALSPVTLQEILRETIESVIDREAFEHEVEQEKQDARRLHETRQRVLRSLQECDLLHEA